MKTGQQARDAVCDTAGGYDVFHVADAIRWNPEFGPQMIRDAVKQLVVWGMLRRLDRGLYAWEPTNGR